MSFRTRVRLLALVGGAPALVALAVALLAGPTRTTTGVLLVLGAAAAWLAGSELLVRAVERPMRTTASLVGALKAGDFAVRARGARSDEPLGEMLTELNELADMLREQRLGVLEATALLQAVIAEMDVAIFAFDHEGRMVFANPAGERTLGEPAERLHGRDYASVGLEFAHAAPSGAIVEARLGGVLRRWEIRRRSFRLGGRSHEFFVLIDLSQSLGREEERAWQRLVRVLGHEINNSLAPIRSIAQTLLGSIKKRPLDPDCLQDLGEGLTVIESRSNSLHGFVRAYAEIARLPAPVLRPTLLAEVIRKAVQVEVRIAVAVDPGDGDVEVMADADQLEQALINLLRNAVDASLETKGKVHVGWKIEPDVVTVYIDDEGSGLASEDNLFVPFFTTKPEGSGIGLVLSRQIALAHHGSLTLQNRADTRGCRAELTLPRASKMRR